MDSLLASLAIFAAFILLAALIRRLFKPRNKPRKRRDIVPPFTQPHIRKP